MVIYDTNIVTALKTILPCYYENFIKADITLPCITYISNLNEAEIDADTQRVSNIGYTIKLWIDDLADKHYLTDIQNKMWQMGFTLVGTNEIVVDRVIQEVMNYEAIGLEVF